MVPERMGRDEAFRKGNDVGPVLRRLRNERSGLRDRTVEIEKRRRRLNGGQPDCPFGS